MLLPVWARLLILGRTKTLLGLKAEFGDGLVAVLSSVSIIVKWQVQVPILRSFPSDAERELAMGMSLHKWLNLSGENAMFASSKTISKPLITAK